MAPNLRGFGDSTHPGEPQTSGTMADLVGDLVCVLQDAKIASAICMGYVILFSVSCMNACS